MERLFEASFTRIVNVIIFVSGTFDLWTDTIDTMINFYGDSDGHGDDDDVTCKLTLSGYFYNDDNSVSWR